MNNLTKLFAFIAIITILISGCKKESNTHQTPTHGISDATTYSAQVAIDWMDEFRNIVKTQSINPPRAARVFAYAGITLYESLVEGIAGNNSLQGQLNGFSLGSIPANTDSLYYDIAVNEALWTMAQCDTIIPSLTAANKDSIDALHDRYLQKRIDFATDTIVYKSQVRGALVAHAIMQYAAGDNFLYVKTLSYSVPTRDSIHPWYWQPTDSSHKNPVEAHWGQIRPFCLATSNAAEIPQTILYDPDTSSAFGRQAQEVYNTVNNRTVDQSNIRFWWSDATGTQTPAGHWIGMLQYIIRDKNFKLSKAAELYALTGIATSDAFISCWDAKYIYNLLRPETYIHSFIQSSWTTSQSDITPPFPEYPSGHSVCSGAAAKVLTSELGTIAFTDSINYPLGPPFYPRSYPSFDSAANEAGISRLYGGIHYRQSIEMGLTQGRNVGQMVINKIHFR